MNLEIVNQVVQLFETSNLFFYTVVVVFSLMIGSFLNVVIYRLPLMLQQGWTSECREYLSSELVNELANESTDESADKPADELANTPKTKQTPLTLSTPASSCPNCQHKIRFYENIPVISWLFLKGKCSQCKTKISFRYPLIEITTAILGFVVAQHFGVSALTFWVMLLTFGLICLTLIDFDHMLLPDQIVLPLMWLGLLLNLSSMFTSIENAVIGAVAGYMSLFSIFWLFKLVTGKEGMGHGDFKLVALFGAWFGWELLPLLILMASFVGAVVGISLMLFKRYSREQAIPFGPYLAVAGWVCLLWGEPIWQWYLSTL